MERSVTHHWPLKLLPGFYLLEIKLNFPLANLLGLDMNDSMVCRHAQMWRPLGPPPRRDSAAKSLAKVRIGSLGSFRADVAV